MTIVLSNFAKVKNIVNKSFIPSSPGAAFTKSVNVETASKATKI